MTTSRKSAQPHGDAAAKAKAKKPAQPKQTKKAPITPVIRSEELKISRRKPPVGRPFEKGRSGNPGGRPKEVGEVRDLARAHTLMAVNRLVELMGDENGRVAAAACTAILDRGWGKPTQYLGQDDERPLVPMLTVNYGK